MSTDGQEIVARLAGELERAWNAGDGEAFAGPFTDSADFVNIRGEHFRGRAVIAQGHQAIFDGIYKGSRIHYEPAGGYAIAPAVRVGQVRGHLRRALGAARRRAQWACDTGAGGAGRRLADCGLPQHARRAAAGSLNVWSRRAWGLRSSTTRSSRSRRLAAPPHGDRWPAGALVMMGIGLMMLAAPAICDTVSSSRANHRGSARGAGCIAYNLSVLPA